MNRRAAATLILLAVLLLAGCEAPATPSAAPPQAAEPTARVVVVTATDEPATVVAPTLAPSLTPQQAALPTAKLSRIEPAGDCRWVAYMYLTGFAANNPITVDAYYQDTECSTGNKLPSGHWQRLYPDRTDVTGRLIVSYNYEAAGSFRYVFTDERGNQAKASFEIAYEVGGTAGQGGAATPAARPADDTATPAVPAPAGTATVEPHDRLAVVKSATLNLRSGPGQNYPVVGKATEGDKLYPVARIGKCDWLEVGVAGQSDLVWVAGGAQYVMLNVPCDTLMIQDSIPPAPTAAPTAVSRPGTGLLSRSGPGGRGILRIKNGTEADGVVILVPLQGSPSQAAYIRAADTYLMDNIADGSYHLYFTKGESWDPQAKEFRINVTRQRFADTLDFSDGNGWEVTLYGVAGGNAGTQNVAPGNFPGLP